MKIQKYSVALLTTFERNKNTNAVAAEMNSSQSSLSRLLNKVSITTANLIDIISPLFGDKQLTFVIDDFVINRIYARETEGVSQMIDQSTKSYVNGVKIVAGGLSDGKHFLPLDLEQWIAKFIAGEGYFTKVDLAQKLILTILKPGLNIEYFVLDGLYFTENFINFLNNLGLKFVIKAKTTTAIIYKGEKMQLKNCPDLRLNTNQNCKKIKAEWHGKMWYFIALRRFGKHGPKVIYLIANFSIKSKIYGKIYDLRWSIEKFIRTGKQKLGLKDSQSRNAKVYLNHVRCVFYAYSILQLVMKKFRLKCTEDALRKIQALKFKFQFSEIF